MKEIVGDEMKGDIAKNKLKKVMENLNDSYNKEKGLAEEKKVDNLFSARGKKIFFQFMENQNHSYNKEKSLAEEKKVDNLFSARGKKIKVVSLESSKFKKKLKNN